MVNTTWPGDQAMPKSMKRSDISSFIVCDFRCNLSPSVFVPRKKPRSRVFGLLARKQSETSLCSVLFVYSATQLIAFGATFSLATFESLICVSSSRWASRILNEKLPKRNCSRPLRCPVDISALWLQSGSLSSITRRVPRGGAPRAPDAMRGTPMCTWSLRMQDIESKVYRGLSSISKCFSTDPASPKSASQASAFSPRPPTATHSWRTLTFSPSSGTREIQHNARSTPAVKARMTRGCPW
mmetsp:Transcript_17556/g.33316  ORF Transcript_17556/g.33316 Transcript_17556/m.33316 type:complete len:241 (+) Transcript_17556:129-851(+)